MVFMLHHMIVFVALTIEPITLCHTQESRREDLIMVMLQRRAAGLQRFNADINNRAPSWAHIIFHLCLLTQLKMEIISQNSRCAAWKTWSDTGVQDPSVSTEHR